MSQIKRQRVGEQADEQCLVGVTKHVQGKKTGNHLPMTGVCSQCGLTSCTEGWLDAIQSWMCPSRQGFCRKRICFIYFFPILGLIRTALASVAGLYLAGQEWSDDSSQSKTQKWAHTKRCSQSLTAQEDCASKSKSNLEVCDEYINRRRRGPGEAGP